MGELAIEFIKHCRDNNLERVRDCLARGVDVNTIKVWIIFYPDLIRPVYLTDPCPGANCHSASERRSLTWSVQSAWRLQGERSSVVFSSTWCVPSAGPGWWSVPSVDSPTLPPPSDTDTLRRWSGNWRDSERNLAGLSRN